MIKSNWHTTIQNSFREQGCQIEKRISQTQNRNCRRADIIYQRTVLEVQHSPISKNEVESRNYDYTQQGYYIFWIINGSAFNIEESRENAFLITLTFPWNHLDHIFSSCKILFASCKYMGKEYIMKFSPNSVRKELIYVSEYFLLKDFIRSFRENCTKLFDPIIENIPCRLIIKQEPPGSGKTYGMVHKIINSLNDGNEEFQPYSTFIILTKPHSAKNVVQREFKDQLDQFNICYEEGEYNNAPWFLLISHNQEKLIILATGDSFVHAIGERDNNSLDMFQGICKKIEQKGPTRLGRDGSVRFKSHPMKVNARTLIIMDEATKFNTVYAFALGKLMLCCLCDAYIIGDKLQSIEYDNNLFTYLMDVDNPFPNVQRYVRKENVIRRGGENLVHFVTTVVGKKTYAENNLPVPISCKDKTIKRDNEGEIEIMFLKNITHDADESSIQKIIEEIGKEMYRLCLLPNDILIILPFVTNNPFGDFLRDKLDDFLLSILENPYYRTIMLNSPYKNKAREYFQNFDENKEQKKEYKQKYERNKNSYQWLAYFHRSETGKPIDTSKSDQAARMVSIHASQGDGRRLAITCQLSEAALKIFTQGNKNLQYNSLIQVSISRAKTKQIVILEKDKNDDIIRRFRPFCEPEQVVQLKPFLNLTNTFYIGKPLFENYGNENKEWITSYHLEHGGGRIKTGIIENEDQIVRNAIFNFTLLIYIYYNDFRYNEYKSQIWTVLNRIYNIPMKLVDHSEYYKILNVGFLEEISFIPIQIYRDKIPECNDIFKECEYVKQNVLQKILRKQDINLEDIKPFQYVLLWYMVQIFLNKKYCLLKNFQLMNIYYNYRSKYFNSLNMHYEYIKKSENIFQKIVSNLEPNGKWNINHLITLACPDGQKTDYFNCRTIVPLVYTTEKTSIAIHILTDTSAMRKDEILTKISYSGLFMSQPFQNKENQNSSGHNKERFDYKEKYIYICSIEEADESRNLEIHKWKDIEPYRKQIIGTLCNYIYQRSVNEHDNVMEFLKYYGENSYAEYKKICKEKQRNKVNYIDYMIQNFVDNYEDYTDDPFNYKKTFMKKFEKKLMKNIEEFKKLVCEK